MNRSPQSAIIGVLVAVIAGLIAYIAWPETTNAPTSTELTEETSTPKEQAVETAPPPSQKTATAPKTATTPVTTPVTKGGTYENYTAAAVGYAALGEVILFFHSTSCPACELLDKDIKTNAARIPKDVKILKVDFDTATDLKQRYGLTSPHILVQVNSKGDRITQWTLSSTLSDLVTRIVRY